MVDINYTSQISNDDKQEYTSSYTVTIVANDVNITLRNSDLLQCYFIEDLFTVSLTGKIQLLDNYGILEMLPVTGNEIIRIIYGDKNDKEKTFLIQKISRISNMGPFDAATKPIVEIFFADPIYFLSSYREYSKSWVNTKISDIIKDISKNMLGSDTFSQWEDTNETLDYFYIPHWNVINTLKWLIRRASGNKSKNSGYVFYSSTESDIATATLNFITLDSLFNQEKLLILEDDDKNKDNGIYAFDAPNMFDYNRILGSNISGVDKNSFRGIMGGRRYGFDPYTNIIFTNEYEYKDMIEKHTLLGKYSLFNDISEKSAVNKLIGEDTSEILNNIYYSEWIKRYCVQNTVSIVVRGHENRIPGKLIEIVWPSADKTDEKFNQLKSGEYLIKSVIHFFSRNIPAYQQKLILIKNGYQNHPTSMTKKGTKINSNNTKTRYIG